MALFTSYLGWFRNHKPYLIDGKETEYLYVMRKRGNRAVEPPEMVLRLAKAGAITWEGYRDAYLDSLDTIDSRMWMQRVAEQSLDKNIVLICFESSPEHCHRRLLAELMAHDYGCEYLGELTESMNTRSK